jgi:hypothetical protein
LISPAQPHAVPPRRYDAAVPYNRGVVVMLLWIAGCGSDAGLSSYYPDLPPPTGEAQRAFAGEVTDASQLLTGPAQSGMVGDFFLRNDRATFIVEAPTRVIGVIPQGGNLVDIALTDGTRQLTADHFGELGLIYRLGRTCEHNRIEIVRDGSKGGVAVLRATGRSGNDDYINIKAVGLLPVDPTQDPDIEDGVECATTYVLAPSSTTLQVYHSLFNAGKDDVEGPMGTIADTGGGVDAWSNLQGLASADISNVATLLQPTPSDYVVYQGPGVAYGVIPREDAPTVHTHVTISGVAIMLNGIESLLDILVREKDFLRMKRGQGVLHRYDIAVGHDAGEIDALRRTANGETLASVTGRVAWSGGGVATGARVGIFADDNGNGQVDSSEHATAYFDVGADGTFGGQVATTAGELVAQAEVKNVGRSVAVPVGATVDLTVPSPIKVDFQISDADTGASIPGRLLVVGNHPVFPDNRLFETLDRRDGIVTQLHAIRGTSVDVGDGADPALYLPAGGTYRIYASRGTEWSADSHPVSGTDAVELVFHLKRVVPTDGYYATDWHVHQVGSSDSPVLSDERVRSAASAGVEMFAVTDHDYVSDLQPLVEQMGLRDLLRVVSGVEVTPFPYGHFNGWPIARDDASPNGGAIDWGRGMVDGFAMIPGEIFDALRARGARMVQVNHPREQGFTEFQAAFERANLKYDYTQRTIYGDYQNAGVPNDSLRLPGESLWSDRFNGLEIWTGFDMTDTNQDGLRENAALDLVMRDWLSMLSLGFYVTPAGNSDTHTSIASPVGMPRTYVRVTDDSPAALADGSAVAAVVQTQTGANNTPRDVIVTNGPMLDVRVGGRSALGSLVSANGEPITVVVKVHAADWAPFDTLELFANTTPEPVGRDGDSTLLPLKCWTSRPIATLNDKDPCARAALAAEVMTVALVPVGGGFQRYEATVTVTLDAADIVNRAGATGHDAWLVFRARGDRGIFPLLSNGDTITQASLPALLDGSKAMLDVALTGHGIFAEAISAPVFVDFDGSGYRAPFAP